MGDDKGTNTDSAATLCRGTLRSVFSCRATTSKGPYCITRSRERDERVILIESVHFAECLRARLPPQKPFAAANFDTLAGNVNVAVDFTE